VDAGCLLADFTSRLAALILQIYSSLLVLIVCLLKLFTFVLWADDEIWTVDEFLERSEEACR